MSRLTTADPATTTPDPSDVPTGDALADPTTSTDTADATDTTGEPAKLTADERRTIARDALISASADLADGNTPNYAPIAALYLALPRAGALRDFNADCAPITSEALRSGDVAYAVQFAAWSADVERVITSELATAPRAARETIDPRSGLVRRIVTVRAMRASIVALSVKLRASERDLLAELRDGAHDAVTLDEYGAGEVPAPVASLVDRIDVACGRAIDPAARKSGPRATYAPGTTWEREHDETTYRLVALADGAFLLTMPFGEPSYQRNATSLTAAAKLARESDTSINGRDWWGDPSHVPAGATVPDASDIEDDSDETASAEGEPSDD